MIPNAVTEFVATLFRRPFIRNILTVAAGTGVAQIIAIAFSPLITRLYGPEVYGLVGVFTSITGVLGTAAALSYPVAIVLPREDADAIGLIRLSLYVGAGTTTLLTLLGLLFGKEIAAALNVTQILPFIWLIPIFMLLAVAGAVLSQWLIRKHAFSLTARVEAVQSAITTLVKVALGFALPTASTLIGATALGALVRPVLLLAGINATYATGGLRFNVSAAGKTCRDLARQYRDFPLFRAPQDLINGLSQALPVILLAAYSGPVSAGLYALTRTVLTLPVGLVGGSVQQVFYPKISEALKNQEDARGLIVRATVGLFSLGLLPLLLVVLFGPKLFALVFGAEWQMAGNYAQWLSVWLFFQFINKPAVAAIPALGLQGGLLVYELFSTGTKVAALYVGLVILKSDIEAVALYSIAGVIAYAWLIGWVIVRSGRINREVT